MQARRQLRPGPGFLPDASVISEDHNVRLVKRTDFWCFDPICPNQMELAAAGSIAYADGHFLQR
jgi:hypothetical protein